MATYTELNNAQVNVLFKSLNRKGFTSVSRGVHLEQPRILSSRAQNILMEDIPDIAPTVTTTGDTIISLKNNPNVPTSPYEFVSAQAKGGLGQKFIFNGKPLEYIHNAILQPVPNACYSKVSYDSFETRSGLAYASETRETQFDNSGANFRLLDSSGNNILKNCLLSGDGSGYGFDMFFNPGVTVAADGSLSVTNDNRLDLLDKETGPTLDFYSSKLVEGDWKGRKIQFPYQFLIDPDSGIISFLQYPSIHINKDFPPIVSFYRYSGTIGVNPSSSSETLATKTSVVPSIIAQCFISVSKVSSIIRESRLINIRKRLDALFACNIEVIRFISVKATQAVTLSNLSSNPILDSLFNLSKNLRIITFNDPNVSISDFSLSYARVQTYDEFTVPKPVSFTAGFSPNAAAFELDASSQYTDIAFGATKTFSEPVTYVILYVITDDLSSLTINYELRMDIVERLLIISFDDENVVMPDASNAAQVGLSYSDGFERHYPFYIPKPTVNRPEVEIRVTFHDGTAGTAFREMTEIELTGPFSFANANINTIKYRLHDTKTDDTVEYILYIQIHDRSPPTLTGLIPLHISRGGVEISYDVTIPGPFYPPIDETPVTPGGYVEHELAHTAGDIRQDETFIVPGANWRFPSQTSYIVEVNGSERSINESGTYGEIDTDIVGLHEIHYIASDDQTPPNKIIYKLNINVIDTIFPTITPAIITVHGQALSTPILPLSGTATFAEVTIEHGSTFTVPTVTMTDGKGSGKKEIAPSSYIMYKVDVDGLKIKLGTTDAGQTWKLSLETHALEIVGSDSVNTSNYVIPLRVVPTFYPTMRTYANTYNITIPAAHDYITRGSDGARIYTLTHTLPDLGQLDTFTVPTSVWNEPDYPEITTALPIYNTSALLNGADVSFGSSLNTDVVGARVIEYISRDGRNPNTSVVYVLNITVADKTPPRIYSVTGDSTSVGSLPELQIPVLSWSDKIGTANFDTQFVEKGTPFKVPEANFVDDHTDILNVATTVDGSSSSPGDVIDTSTLRTTYIQYIGTDLHGNVSTYTMPLTIVDKFYPAIQGFSLTSTAYRLSLYYFINHTSLPNTTRVYIYDEDAKELKGIVEEHISPEISNAWQIIEANGARDFFYTGSGKIRIVFEITKESITSAFALDNINLIQKASDGVTDATLQTISYQKHTANWKIQDFSKNAFDPGELKDLSEQSYWNATTVGAPHNSVMRLLKDSFSGFYDYETIYYQGNSEIGNKAYIATEIITLLSSETIITDAFLGGSKSGVQQSYDITIPEPPVIRAVDGASIYTLTHELSEIGQLDTMMAPTPIWNEPEYPDITTAHRTNFIVNEHPVHPTSTSPSPGISIKTDVVGTHAIKYIVRDGRDPVFSAEYVLNITVVDKTPPNILVMTGGSGSDASRAMLHDLNDDIPDLALTDKIGTANFDTQFIEKGSVFIVFEARFKDDTFQTVAGGPISPLDAYTMIPVSNVTATVDGILSIPGDTVDTSTPRTTQIQYRGTDSHGNVSTYTMPLTILDIFVPSLMVYYRRSGLQIPAWVQSSADGHTDEDPRYIQSARHTYAYDDPIEPLKDIAPVPYWTLNREGTHSFTIKDPVWSHVIPAQQTDPGYDASNIPNLALEGEFMIMYSAEYWVPELLKMHTAEYRLSFIVDRGIPGPGFDDPK